MVPIRRHLQGAGQGQFVTKGRLPWSPSPGARDLHVWYEYEYPYVGTFVASDVTVLFNFLESVETETTVWAYTCLEPDEVYDLVGVSFAQGFVKVGVAVRD